jgi:hypothetical protein
LASVICPAGPILSVASSSRYFTIEIGIITRPS